MPSGKYSSVKMWQSRHQQQFLKDQQLREATLKKAMQELMAKQLQARPEEALQALAAAYGGMVAQGCYRNSHTHLEVGPDGLLHTTSLAEYPRPMPGQAWLQMPIPTRAPVDEYEYFPVRLHDFGVQHLGVFFDDKGPEKYWYETMQARGYAMVHDVEAGSSTWEAVPDAGYLPTSEVWVNAGKGWLELPAGYCVGVKFEDSSDFKWLSDLVTDSPLLYTGDSSSSDSSLDASLPSANDVGIPVLLADGPTAPAPGVSQDGMMDPFGIGSNPDPMPKQCTDLSDLDFTPAQQNLADPFMGHLPIEAAELGGFPLGNFPLEDFPLPDLPLEDFTIGDFPFDKFLQDMPPFEEQFGMDPSSMPWA